MYFYFENMHKLANNEKLQRNLAGSKRIWLDLFFPTPSQNKCEYCFRSFYNRRETQKHQQNFHQGAGTKKCPYTAFLTDYCPLGCTKQMLQNKTLKQHLILYHSYNELKKWGFSRQYLKYQEGQISFEEVLRVPLNQSSASGPVKGESQVKN